MKNILMYLNENPGVGIVVGGMAVVATIAGWFIKEKQKAIYKKSHHINAGGNISAGKNIVVGNSNVIEETSIPEFHLHLYGAGSKRKIEGHIEKKDDKMLIVESLEIDGSETTINRQFTKLLSLKNLNHSDSLFTTKKQDIKIRVAYKTPDGRRFEFSQKMTQKKRADNLFNISLDGTPHIKKNSSDS